jgi:hypothetical protein
MEWIATGSLVDRVNFAVKELADVDKPGVRSIINRIRAQGERMSPEGLVDACLDLMGPISVSEDTRRELLDHAVAQGEIQFGSEEEAHASAQKVAAILQLIVATREYQLA